MYRRSLNPAAREQNTDEINPPGLPCMNPVRGRLPTGRHQENSQTRRQENAGSSEHREHLRATYSDAQQVHEEHHLRPKCSVCWEEAVAPTTIACGHTFCFTCLSQHWSVHQPSTLICPISLTTTGSCTDIDSSFPLQFSWASQLIFVDHAGKIKLNMDVVENCFMSDAIRDIPVYLLCVVGEKRTGKSFLMNYIISTLQNQVKGNEFSLGRENEPLKGFEWKSGNSGTTKGVWIWREPFLVENDGKKMALFVLDSEGLMDIENDRNNSIKLCSAAMLLSTHLIYNVRNRIDEKEVDYLEIFLLQTAQQAEQNKPYLDVIVRDWHDYEDCRSEAAELYLRKQVEILRKKNISPAVLEALGGSNNKCFLFPYPGREIARSNTGKLQEMEKVFCECLTSYLKDLLERLKYPAMTGAQMAEMMKGTISHFQSLRYDFSSPQEMSYYIQNHGEMQKTCMEFREFLLSLSSLQLPGTMWECISVKSQELVEIFEKSFRGNNDTIRTDLVEELRTTLKKEGEKFYSDYKWNGMKYASSALLFTLGPAAGGLMFAGESTAAAAAASTGFIPTALSYAQYFAAAFAGRFLGRWL